jgi:hypothetical protein
MMSKMSFGVKLLAGGRGNSYFGKEDFSLVKTRFTFVAERALSRAIC